MYGDVQRYPSKAIWLAPSTSNQLNTGSFTQLSRATDAGWTINYRLQDGLYVDQSVYAYDTTPASVDVSLVWWHTNARNERAIGLADLGVSGRMGFNLEQEKNLYIAVENARGVDAVGTTSGTANKTVLALGQCLLTSYELSAAVGGLIQSQASLNGLTAYLYTGGTGNPVPTVNYQNGVQLAAPFALPAPSAQYDAISDDPTMDVAAISARDMILTFPANSPFAVVFTGENQCYLQSFSLGLAIDRREVKPLGYVYPPNRSTFYPIQVSFSTEAIVSRYQADQLARLNCAGAQQIHVHVKQPCSNLTMFGYYLDEMQIVNQSFTTSIGAFDTVTTQWRGLINSPNTMLFDPTFNYLVDLSNTGVWGSTW